MNVNSKVMVMREAITKIVPMLTQKKVSVTLRGMRAFVEYSPVTHEPVRVNLPYLPDDSTDELIAAVQGFLDHEVGHILFSDPAQLERSIKANKTIAFLHNAIEDPMIAEAKMKEQFPGSAFNFSSCSAFFIDQVVKPEFDSALKSGDAQGVTATLMVPAIRAWAGQQEFAQFMSDKWSHVDDWVKAIGQDLIDEIKTVDDSKDAADLAFKMFDRIKTKKQPSPSEQPKSSNASEPSEQQKQEEQEKEQTEDSELQEDQDKFDSPEPLDEEASEELIAAISSQMDFGSALAEALTTRAQSKATSSEYLIFTRDDDVIEPMPYTASDIAEISHMQDAVASMLGPLSSAIERMVAARSAAIWTGGHKSGRLHGSSLTRTTFGHTDVFRRKQDNKTKNVAVSLLVDCSGSMQSDSKLETACYTAYALASILDRLSIKCEVIGFTTREPSAQVKRDMANDPLHREYCRSEALYMPVFKSFDERVSSEVRSRTVAVKRSYGLCRSNVDGECVLIAAQRLNARPEARKILMVLSDGNPAVRGGKNLEDHLKASVKHVEASGIDVIGLGIMDRSVAKFYKNHVLMRSVEDLPSVVLGELKRLLTR